RYVMVDEFQDTNTLQLEILLPLLDDLSSGNLIIVGDPKQSIYRFRDADVEVFDRSRGAIARNAGEESLVGLGESFRPLRDIVAFVNLLFGGVMRAGEGISYEPLVRARANDDPGGVEILMAPGPEEGESSQEQLVARRILHLVGAGSVVYAPGEVPRPAAFRDIALLLRSRNALEGFEQAFIQHGIPYLVSGGAGYFQTQDLYDVYNYLRFLLDPSDDVALAGILRAPFFTVSDAALFELSRGRGGKTLWAALVDAGTAVGAPAPLAHASGTLARDIALGTRLPAAELIARIVRGSGFAAALAGTVRGAQAEANLGKLLEMARAYESQGFTSLYDFVRRLERLIEEEEKEGQAVIESRTDAVRIMTIHAAKGLEFPVVVVPDLQRPFQSDDEPFVDADLGIGLAGGGASRGEPLSEYLREQARRQAAREEQRILYVACTRARDRLLLSAGNGRRGESWLDWLEQCCEDHGQTLESDALRFECVTPRYDGSGTVDESHPLCVPVHRTLAPVPGSGITHAPPRRGVRIDIAPLHSGSKGEIFSASRIRTYVECPAKYFFRYILGVPSGNGPFAPETGEEFGEGDYPAELRGRLFHSVMENADDLAKSAVRDIDSAVRASLARESPLPADGYPSLVSDVASLVRGVLDSPSWPDISAGGDVKKEFSISAALGGDFITGTIDRLYRAADGLWTVLDYKTDRIGPSDLEQRAGAYWAQLDFYALMVHRLCDAPRVRTRILFAHHPDVVLQKILQGADLRRQEEFIAGIIARIKSGEFPPTVPPCRGCPMHPGPCSAG
ncbi:MAG TPA: 3'-5' exonuclease, partial [Bacteroidota bacterium]|nr:3'-5' exonuclease [Bacteroidota bacterium]